MREMRSGRTRDPRLSAKARMKRPSAILAADAPPRAKQTGYPADMAKMVAGRSKHPLGDLFGLTNFGVNLTRLAPGAYSALRHAHAKQDEFVYLLEGEA